MPSNCGVGDSWESLGQQGDQTSQSLRKSVLNIHWKDWCWSWNSNTLATWCEELTYWKRPWFWERWKTGGEGDDRGLGGWMASPVWWIWVWASSGSCWWTGKPGVLQSKGLQIQTRLSHWTELMEACVTRSHLSLISSWVCDAVIFYNSHSIQFSSASQSCPSLPIFSWNAKSSHNSCSTNHVLIVLIVFSLSIKFDLKNNGVRQVMYIFP